MKHARIVAGLAVDVIAGDPVELFHPDIAAEFAPVPDEVEEGWRQVGDGWEAPASVEPPPPAAPSSYYLAKVTFERRFGDAAFAALDAARITVRARPADWAASDAEPWPTLRPFVRAFSDYDAADEVNVGDPAMVLLLGGLQAALAIFGDDEEAAAAEIARILTVGRLPGEPVR